MKTHLLPDWIQRHETKILKVISWIPQNKHGETIRRFVSEIFFAHLGQAVSIGKGVEFLGASNIELGDGVSIRRGTCIDVRDRNSRLYLRNNVILDKNVEIRDLDHTQIEIGEHTMLNLNVLIMGPGNIKIGRYCLIAPYVSIVAANRNFADPTRKIAEQGTSSKGITIEENCWLGHRVSVLDGVTIGQGSVIGAGAVVTKDIPPFSIAVGVPARIVGSRSSAKDAELSRTPKQAALVMD